MEEFYSPASCTSLTHYPEGAAGQGDNTASCSQLARATVVSGIVSDADRSPTAATNQESLPTLPFRPRMTHPLWRSPRLTVWPISRSAIEQQAFHRKLSRFSSHRGLQPARKGTVPPGILGPSGVPVMRVILPCKSDDARTGIQNYYCL